MAIRPLSTVNRGNMQTVTWAGLTTDDTGQPWERSDFSDKCAQIFGDFGTTASVALEGSNDPRVLSAPSSAVWFALTDPQGNDIVKTAADGEQLLENPRWIRPAVTLGTNPSITVIIEATKGF